MSALDDLPPDQARLWLHRIAGWVADYRDKLTEQRVSPDVSPEEIAGAFPSLPPEHGDKLAAILEDVERFVVPGIVHAGHPKFLDEHAASVTTPSIAGHWLGAALGADARSSPMATALEVTTLGWIRSVLGLAERLEGMVLDSPAATLQALAVARNIAYPDVRRRGLAGSPPLMIYTSADASGDVEQVALTLGLGSDSIRRVETDGEHRLRPAALRATVARDVHARLRPLAVVATVGTHACGAVDPVPAIADVCAEHKLWLHVDASRGGALAVLPEGRWVLDGVGRADSVVVSPHAWLFVPSDFTVIYTRRAELLHAVARTDRTGRAVLEAWIALRALGRVGLEARIREQLRLARSLANWVEADPDFELMAPTLMALVSFRARPAGRSDAELDELNRCLVASVNATGRAYLTETRVGGAVAMRIAIGNPLTEESHVADAWTLIHDAFDRTLVD